MDNQSYHLRDLNCLQIVVDYSIAHQQGTYILRTQASQTDNKDEEDDEDSFKDYETDEDEYEAT